MTTFEALYLMLTFGLLLMAVISYLDKNNNTKK